MDVHNKTIKTFQEFLAEARGVNKFNIYWQIVRVRARKIKDVGDKIDFVLDFLNKNKNIHNFGRVHNWLKMTGVAYKGEKRKAFEDTVKSIEARKDEFSSSKDNPNDLSKISQEDLKLVLKDLKTRKYGFQFKSAPKAHVEFLAALEKAIKD